MELANYIISHANILIVFGVFFGYASWAIYIGVNDKKKWKEQARAIQALIQAPGIPPANDPLKVGVRIKELEKPQLPMYRCIKLPARNSAGFKLGELYVYSMRGCDFSYSELPLHFELVEPEPVKDPINMSDVLGVLDEALRMGEYSYRVRALAKRIKEDYSL